MRKLLQQIKRELKTLRCLRGRTQPRLAGRSESARTRNSRDLLSSMAFACDFTVTVYAPLSIESLLGAAKTSLFGACSNNVKHAQVGRAVLCKPQWVDAFTRTRRCIAARSASNASNH